MADTLKAWLYWRDHWPSSFLHWRHLHSAHPFQTAGVDIATAEQIVPVEALIALRESSDARSMVEQRSVEPGGVSIAPLFDVSHTSCIARNSVASQARERANHEHW